MKKLRRKECNMVLIGLTPKSLGMAVEWSRHFSVTLYDECEDYIQLLNSGIDPFGELDHVQFDGDIAFSSDKRVIRRADVVVLGALCAEGVDLQMALKEKVKVLASQMSAGVSLIFESEVKLKWIERIYLTIIEKLSGLELGSDFNIGFVPALEDRLQYETINSCQLVESHNSISDAIQRLYSYIPTASEIAQRQAVKHFLAKEWSALAEKMRPNIPGIVMPLTTPAYAYANPRHSA